MGSGHVCSGLCKKATCEYVAGKDLEICLEECESGEADPKTMITAVSGCTKVGRCIFSPGYDGSGWASTDSCTFSAATEDLVVMEFTCDTADSSYIEDSSKTKVLQVDSTTFCKTKKLLHSGGTFKFHAGAKNTKGKFKICAKPR